MFAHEYTNPDCIEYKLPLKTSFEQYISNSSTTTKPRTDPYYNIHQLAKLKPKKSPTSTTDLDKAIQASL